MKTIIVVIEMEIDESIAPEEFVSNFEEEVDNMLNVTTLPVDCYTIDFLTTIPNTITKDRVILTGAEDA